MITTKQAEVLDYVVQEGNTTQVGSHLEVDGNLEVNSKVLVNGELINFISLFGIEDSDSPTTTYSFETIKELLLQNRLNGFIDDSGNVYRLSYMGDDPDGRGEAISLGATYLDSEYNFVFTEFRFVNVVGESVATIDRNDIMYSSGI